MRVAMFGYQTWGHRTLRALIDSDHEVAMVVTHPRSEHAYEKIWSDSVADLAREHGIEVLVRNRPDDDELRAKLKEADLDIMVANNWRTWLPPEIFTMPRIAAFRSFVMSHLIHHRGQLSVYLRLNDVAVPSIYGPSADEAF